MPNALITRGTGPTQWGTTSNGVASLVPEDASKEIIQGAVLKSAALTLFPHRRMAQREQRIPVVATFPTAGFVAADTGMKPVSDMTWANIYLVAEEVAITIAMPEAVLDDSPYDLWDEVRPRAEEAIALVIDRAALFGIGAPTTWPSGLTVAAIAAGNTVTQGALGGTSDVADDINLVMSAIEADGFDVNGFLIKVGMKGELRGLRTTSKEFVFLPDQISALSNGIYAGTLFGEKTTALKSGVFEAQSGANQVKLIAGDWSQGVIGLRTDMRAKFLTEGVLQDPVTGEITHNLPQQDLVALRLYCRLGFAVPNPINRLNSNSSTRYPFAVLRAAA